MDAIDDCSIEERKSKIFNSRKSISHLKMVTITKIKKFQPFEGPVRPLCSRHLHIFSSKFNLKKPSKFLLIAAHAFLNTPQGSEWLYKNTLLKCSAQYGMNDAIFFHHKIEHNRH
jgi:hypothetical protein